MLFCLSDTRKNLFLGRTSLVNVDVLNYEWGMSLQPCLAALGALAVHQKTPTAWQPLQGRIRQKLPGLYSAPQDCEERRDPPDPKDWKQGHSVSSWNTVCEVVCRKAILGCFLFIKQETLLFNQRPHLQINYFVVLHFLPTVMTQCSHLMLT